MLKFIITLAALILFAYYAHYWIGGFYYDIPYLDFI